MFRNGMLIADYKDELIGLYGYSEELAEDIAMSAETLRDYFGEEYEDVILDAIRNTRVVLVDKTQNGVRETIKTVLEREGMIENVKGVAPLKDSEVRNLESMYAEKPNIVYGSEGFHVSSVDKVAVINRGYVDDLYFKANLIDVFMRAVKSHLKAYAIDGNVMTVKKGLTTRTETLSIEDGEIKRTFVDEIGFGLENGILNYDKLGAVRENYAGDYDLQYSSYSVPTSGILMDLLNLKGTLREAQVTKDTASLEALIEEYGGVSYTEFLRMMDDLWTLERKLAESSVKDKDLSNSVAEELAQFFEERVATVTRTMRASMKVAFAEEEKMMTAEGTSL